MDHTFVDENSLKSLEDYAIFLTSGMLTLNTLQNLQVRALKIGIMKEDMNERANTIIWDIRRQIKLYQMQLEAVLELTGDFDATKSVEKLMANEVTRARSMIRKAKEKKDEIHSV